MDRLRTLLALLVCLAVAAGLAACGDDDTAVDESTDAATVLDRTFSSDSTIESAVINLAFSFDVSRGNASSTFKARVTGPIDSSGEGIPVFDLEGDIKAESPTRNLDDSGGAISTGDAAFVSYQGKTYEVDPQTFEFLTGAFEQSEEAAASQEDETSAGLPGFRDFLTDVKNEGT